MDVLIGGFFLNVFNLEGFFSLCNFEKHLTDIITFFNLILDFFSLKNQFNTYSNIIKKNIVVIKKTKSTCLKRNLKGLYLVMTIDKQRFLN